VEVSPYAIDIYEWRWASMRAIRQQNKHSVLVRINPAACAGESVVTEAVGWK